MGNRYARGKDEYPSDLNDAYSIIVDYATPTNTGGGRGWSGGATTATTTAPEASATTFAHQNVIPDTDGNLFATVTCFRCDSLGHCPDRCPSDITRSTMRSTTGTTLLQHAYMLAQSKASGIDHDWILLDSQSTISVFKNRDMLTNVRRSPHVPRAITNRVYQDSTMIGDFPNLGEVWYNAESIANILSLADVCKVCRVMMDTTAERAMCVHCLDSSVMKFSEHPSGLYVFAGNGASKDKVIAYSMLTTVTEQKKMFSWREIKAADNARAFYRKLGRPNEAEYQALLR